ncbi:MAG: polyphosphate kinase 1 [Synergistaceae bacterium]|jgi:polyphosphate kinase|nr:polyphosphate kinase 1 [Synergistaceae bacterium]
MNGDAASDILIRENPEKRSEYINRELSWVRFNRRVLDEAFDKSKPLLERVKFAAIYSNNLDEFFMIRVSGLVRQFKDGVIPPPPDGMTPLEQLVAIRRAIAPDNKRLLACWHNELQPELLENGIEILNFRKLSEKHRYFLDQYFKNEIFPTLTPLAFDPGHPFPHISNLSMNFALALRDERGNERFARLKIPESFPRLFRLPHDLGDKEGEAGLRGSRTETFVWLEDVIEANLSTLFPGMTIEDAVLFHVTRDADFEIESDEAEDLLHSIHESVGKRRFGLAVRLQIERGAPRHIREILTQNLELDTFQVYSTEYPVGLSSLMQLYSLDRPELKYSPFTPGIRRETRDRKRIFDAVRERDMLLYHPYDSFKPVVDFIYKASLDPDVLAIKQTLYRVGSNSPIVEALKEACSRGKQVAALVELKARFDEENNIGWARALEGAGVHVVYGLPGLKTHAKICLVVRREKDGIRRYVHLGTGNYNAVTAGVYTDFGLFTANPDIGADASDLFNVLTGYSAQKEYRKLLVAPHTLRREIISRIDREISRHVEDGGGRLIFKLNAVSDKGSIDALYKASQAGVKIDLQVRGICCLRPGVKGLSENIRVSSIVGRFLEHTRAFYFRNGGDDELYLGSADLMTRNLDRRVECLFPVESPEIRREIIDTILSVHLGDNVQCCDLAHGGSYKKLTPGDAPAVDSQRAMLERRCGLKG